MNETLEGELESLNLVCAQDMIDKIRYDFVYECVEVVCRDGKTYKCVGDLIFDKGDTWSKNGVFAE